MKAITLHQPWAGLISDSRKLIETRCWPAPTSLVGQRIATHAGRTVDRGYARAFGYDSATIPSGCVVCCATLLGVGQVLSSDDNGILTVRMKAGDRPTSAQKDDYGDYSPGRWLWFFKDVQPIDPPTPARGKQGFWDWMR